MVIQIKVRVVEPVLPVQTLTVKSAKLRASALQSISIKRPSPELQTANHVESVPRQINQLAAPSVRATQGILVPPAAQQCLVGLVRRALRMRLCQQSEWTAVSRARQMG